MIQITCPSCQRNLKLAENLQGKQIRCPACKDVFRVEAPAEEIMEVEPVPQPVQPRPTARSAARPAPPPPPAEEEPLEMMDEGPARPVARPAPRRRPAREPEEDFEDVEPGADPQKGRRIARRGAVALLFAVGFDVVAWILFIVLLVTSGPVGAPSGAARFGIAVIAVLSFLYFLPVIFMGIAAALLNSLRGRGMVITGCIMAFFAALELLPYTGLWGLAVASAISGPNINFGRLILPLALVTFCVLGLVSSISAGIRGLVALGKPAVKAAYRQR